jgi:hypothetical protein
MMDWIVENNWIIFLAIVLVAVRVGWKLHEAWMLWVIAEHPERMKMVLAVSDQAREMSDDERGEFVERIKAARETGELEQLANFKAQGHREMDLERVGNELYAYARDTGQFLAQGATVEAITDVLRQRFPNDKFFGVISQNNSAKQLAK